MNLGDVWPAIIKDFKPCVSGKMRQEQKNVNIAKWKENTADGVYFCTMISCPKAIKGL